MNNETEPQPIDLNLPKTSIRFFSQDTHQDIYQDIYKIVKKRMNHETVPMTIRIDEMVYAGIKNSAKKEGVSINVLVSEILSSYVDATSGGLYVNLKIQETAICDFLDRLQKSYLDDKKLTLEMNKIKKHVKMNSKLHPDWDPSLYIDFDFFNILIRFSNFQEAGYRINTPEEVGELGYIYEIHIPERKFYILAPILLECSRKKESLGWQEEPSVGTLEKICRIINSTKQTKPLIRKITEALKPNGDRTSIWYKESKGKEMNEL